MPAMGLLEILGSSGDIKIEWDPNDEGSIAQARAEFDAVAGKGFAVMRINEDGTTDRAETFDATEARYVAIPQLVGG